MYDPVSSIIDIKAFPSLMKNIGFGSSASDSVEKILPIARYLLTSLLLADPTSTRTFSIKEIVDAMNTFCEEINIPSKNEEEILQLLNQLITYSLVFEGENSFGRIKDTSFVILNIINYFLF